jgi:hypothetical protein
MIERVTGPRSGIRTAVGILSAVDAVTPFCGALLHLGVRIPLGTTILAEPTILPAATVESLCGLVAVLALLLTAAGRTAFRREA